MSSLLLRVFIGIILLCSNAYAQTENISDFTPETLPVLNDSLRSLNGTLNRARDTLATIATYFTGGILKSSNGGTNANLSTCTQGSIPYFSATGTMTCLAPGTSGYFLKTQGASANPTYDVPPGNGNIIYAFGDGGTGRYYTQTTSTPPASATLGYQMWDTDNNATYVNIQDTRFRKTAGINTLTFYVSQASRNGGGSTKSRITINSGNITSTEGESTAGAGVITWVNGTVDVSSLTNGTVYDLKVQLSSNGTAGEAAAFGGIIFGS